MPRAHSPSSQKEAQKYIHMTIGQLKDSASPHFPPIILIVVGMNTQQSYNQQDHTFIT